MSKLVVDAFSLSVEGYGAGADQSRDDPLGRGGEALHDWMGAGDDHPIDRGHAERSMRDVGAWIMGRNMFTHERGAWSDSAWRGWWGAEPPFGVPVFVLSHHARPSLVVGATIFHFVTGGIDEALDRAREVAGDRHIRLGGGVATIRQYLAAELIDEMRLVLAPVLLGAGEPLLIGLDLPRLGYRVVDREAGERVTHLLIRRD